MEALSGLIALIIFSLIIAAPFIIYFKYKDIKLKRTKNSSKINIKPTKTNAKIVTDPSKAYTHKKYNASKQQSNETIIIKYIDQKGDITTREVSIYSVDNKYIEAFCYLRNDNRTFLINRVIEVYDNGMEYDGSSYFKQLNRNEESKKKYIDDGYFYSKVDSEYIIDINKDFEIYYDVPRYKLNVEVIRLGKTKSGRLFLLCKYTNSDRFGGLYVFKIRKMIDLTTGEIISDTESYFREKYDKHKLNVIKAREKREERERVDKIIEQNENLLKLILYITKADGKLQKKEKDVLVNLLNKLKIEDAQKVIERAAYKKLFFRSYNSFTRNAQKIIDQYKDVNFYEVAINIIGDKKKIHSDEEKILSYLNKKYKKQ